MLKDSPFRLQESPSAPQLLAKYFRGLGDPTRLRILELLDDGELTVGEICERLGAAQATVSTHLGCLRWCGFVSSRRDHPRVLYRAADPRVHQIVGLGRSLLADNAEHVAACSAIDTAGR